MLPWKEALYFPSHEHWAPQLHFQEDNYRQQNENPEAYYQTCKWKGNMRLESTNSQLPLPSHWSPGPAHTSLKSPKVISSKERCHLIWLREEDQKNLRVILMQNEERAAGGGGARRRSAFCQIYNIKLTEYWKPSWCRTWRKIESD